MGELNARSSSSLGRLELMRLSRRIAQSTGIIILGSGVRVPLPLPHRRSQLFARDRRCSNSAEIPIVIVTVFIHKRLPSFSCSRKI